MRNFRTLIASLVGTLSALKGCTDHWDISTLTPRVDRSAQHHSQRKRLRRDHVILLSVFQFWGNGSCVHMSTITFTGIRHTHTTTWKYPGKLRSYGSSNYLHYPVQSYDLKFTSIERSSRCLSFILDVRGICRICANNHKQQPELRTHVWLPLDIHIIHPLPRIIPP